MCTHHRSSGFRSFNKFVANKFTEQNHTSPISFINVLYSHTGACVLVEDAERDNAFPYVFVEDAEADAKTILDLWKTLKKIRI